MAFMKPTEEENASTLSLGEGKQDGFFAPATFHVFRGFARFPTALDLHWDSTGVALLS